MTGIHIEHKLCDQDDVIKRHHLSRTITVTSFNFIPYMVAQKSRGSGFGGGGGGGGGGGVDYPPPPPSLELAIENRSTEEELKRKM